MNTREQGVGLLAAAAALASTGAMAGVIQTNAGITSSALAYAAATSGDPAIYVYSDGYDKDWTTQILVGGTSSTNGGCDYVQLQINAGSGISSSNTGITYIGIDNTASSYNSVLITGSGASLSVGGALRVGSQGNNNSLTVEAGGILTPGGAIYAGYGTASAFASSNSIVVNNGTIAGSGRSLWLGYQDGAAYNTMTISNGSVVTVGASNSHTTIGRYGDHNNLTVTGAGSKFVQEAGNFIVTFDGTNSRGDNNTLTIASDALVQIVGTGNGNLSVATTSAGNYVQFKEGFLAWNGNHTSGLNPLTQVQLWNGSAYVTPTTLTQAVELGWSSTFYSADGDGEAAALAATGYAGLGGYTVFTGGVVPEPASLGFLSLVLGEAMLRRTRRRSK